MPSPTLMVEYVYPAERAGTIQSAEFAIAAKMASAKIILRLVIRKFDLSG